MRKGAMLALASAAVAMVIPAVAASRSAWPAESVAGKIEMVEPAQKVVVVESQDKVAYDIVVTPRTRMIVGDHSVTLKDLAQYQNRDVTVRFVPEGRGDIARTIHIGG